MGVYIDIEKPKECKKCKFCIVEAKVEGKIYPLNAYCFVQNQDLKDFDDCPLIDIVTCGECKFWESAKNGWNGYCNKKVDAFNTFYKTDWCSFGERRADEGITE